MTSPKLTIEDMKKIDPDLSKLTDEEIEQIKVELYAMAQLAFDVWWHKKRDSNYPLGSSQS